MTVTDAFKTFKSQLELPDRKQTEAASAQQAMRTKVAQHLTVFDSFLTGSYARYTKIDPLNDIDVMFVRNGERVALSSDGSGVYPDQALTQLVDAVQKAYLSAQIEKQARSVNVQRAGYSFGFDLIPAWLRSPNGFWIPDRETGTWLPTDPQSHADLLTAANKKSGEMLKPVIKMIKHWSRNNYDRIRSFHI